jgi:hypothetical protein
VPESSVGRYYLAIDANHSALEGPEPERLERRLQAWFTSTERHPRQLRKVSRIACIQMKRSR